MSKNIFFILICLLVISLIGNGYLLFSLIKANKFGQIQKVNYQMLDFRNMFTEEVLLADKEVSFDTRLRLETAVRNLKDQEVFDQWQNFVKSSTKEDASLQAKKLLHMLVEKTSD